LIAKDSDFLIAFTFGEKGPIGGIKDTYDKYLAMGKKNARHVSLVGVTNDTPPVPPTKAEVPVKAPDIEQAKSQTSVLACSFPCPLEIPFKELDSIEGFPVGVNFDSVKGEKFTCAETMYQWVKAEVMWPFEVNLVNPSDTAKEARLAVASMHTEAQEDPFDQEWESLKFQVMQVILEEKFNNLPIKNMAYANLPALLVTLTQSGTKELKATVSPAKLDHDLDDIVEVLYAESAEPDHDWGIWDGKGGNRLGKMLTAIGGWATTKKLAGLFAEGTHTLFPS
jgi:hypothetical protein